MSHGWRTPFSRPACRTKAPLPPENAWNGFGVPVECDERATGGEFRAGWERAGVLRDGRKRRRSGSEPGSAVGGSRDWVSAAVGRRSIWRVREGRGRGRRGMSGSGVRILGSIEWVARFRSCSFGWCPTADTNRLGGWVLPGELGLDGRGSCRLLARAASAILSIKDQEVWG